jgi:hypothetical protein
MFEQGDSSMVNSVSSSAAVTQQYVQNQHPAKPPAKPKQAEKQDTVVLSHKAQTGDPDHDGD